MGWDETDEENAKKLAERIASAVEETLKEAPTPPTRWISVDEALPITVEDLVVHELRYKVEEVVVSDGTKVWTTNFRAGNTFDFWSSFNDTEGIITHWMYLPLAPEVK